MIFEGQQISPSEPGGIVTECIESGHGLLLLDSPALPPEFFDLGTGVLGVIAQRATQYAIRLAAVVPDLQSRSEHFQAFVREANRGVHLHFAQNRPDAIRWLETGSAVAG